MEGIQPIENGQYHHTTEKKKLDTCIHKSRNIKEIPMIINSLLQKEDLILLYNEDKDKRPKY